MFLARHVGPNREKIRLGKSLEFAMLLIEKSDEVRCRGDLTEGVDHSEM